MKKILLASAAAAVALTAAPAMAESNGFFGANYIRSEAKAGGFKAESDTFAVDGKVAFATGGNWGVQLDGLVARTDGDGDDYTSVGGTAHLFHRNDQFLAGAFVGASDVDGTTVISTGVEGQVYLANTTLAGTIAYADIDDLNADVWGGQAQVRHFVSDNFRLDATLGAGQLKGGGVKAEFWNAGVGAEYQLAASPISFYGAYDRIESKDLGKLKSDVFSVGVRYTFGGDLKTRDRSGASLDGLRVLTGGLF